MLQVKVTKSTTRDRYLLAYVVTNFSGTIVATFTIRLTDIIDKNWNIKLQFKTKSDSVQLKPYIAQFFD